MNTGYDESVLREFQRAFRFGERSRSFPSDFSAKTRARGKWSDRRDDG